MPRLILFVPCEKPLLGADNSLSLINVLHSVTVSVSSKDADDAMSSQLTEWHIVAVWQRDETEDEGARFEQLVTFTDPVGHVRLQVTTEFELTKTYHRNMGRIAGFPVLSGDGECTLAVSLRNLKDKEWSHKGNYPLRVTMRRITESKPPSARTTPRTH